MKKISILFIVLCLFQLCFGQRDSIKNSNTYTAFRASIVFDMSPFLEFGISRIIQYDKGINLNSSCFYTAGQISINNGPKNYGIKIGFETSWMIGMWAIETKYVTDGRKSKFYFTPKAGLSLLGFANILYGHNFQTGKSEFFGIGKHQITLTVHLSKKIIQGFK